MKIVSLPALAVAGLLSSGSFRAEPLAAPTVVVAGAVETPLRLTSKDLKQLPRTDVTVNDHGKAAVYQGVLLSTLLEKAGAPIGKALHGKVLASYVLATARDGYQVVYALAELDPAVTPARLLLADTLEGNPLPGELGPFRLVAPDDKKMARSVRMVEKIEVVRLRP